MLRRKLKQAVGLMAVVLTAGFLTGNANAQALEPIKVRLDWTPWAIHGAIHLAQQKGWFKAAGLEPAVEDGNGSVTTV
jgi:NitT/TauT family transport system substrate-binding protein